MAKVLLNVPLVGQKTGYDGRPLMQAAAGAKPQQHGFMACWYAAACMIAYYRVAGPRIGLPTVWKADQGLQIAEIVELAKAEGLKVVPAVPAKWTDAALADLLGRCGPIWSAGYFLDQDAAAGHVVVLTGIDGALVHYNDPWEPQRKVRSLAWFDQKLGRPWAMPMLYHL